MGIKKASSLTEESPKSSNAGMPWYLKSGIYLAACVKIAVEKDDETGAICFRFTFRPLEDSPAVIRQKPPSPLDIPDFEEVFDAKEDRNAVFALIGKPMVSKERTVWGGEGLLQWNGHTDDKCKVAGTVEIVLNAKPPNPKKDRPGQFWPAQYTIEDICKVGEAQEMADKVASDLAASIASEMNESDDDEAEEEKEEEKEEDKEEKTTEQEKPTKPAKAKK